MGKAKKIIAGVLVVAVAGTGIGAGLMQLRKNSQKEVEVTPVSGLLQEYYQQSTNLDGQIASSATQTVTGDKDLVVDQVFVSKGDNVKKDDPLISFDTTLVEMELNIAKLKKQKQEQDLTKAANRLNSLLNGGPVQESDSGTDADNTLDTTTGSDSEGDDDMTPDSAMSSAADFSGNYLAAAIHPYLLAAFTDGTSDDPETDTSGAASSGADADNTGNTDDSSADTNGSSISETPSYTDPSASEFGDGQDNNSFNSGDNNDTPQLSPTPTPVLDDHTSCFDPY